jgi:uncharacterized protein
VTAGDVVLGVGIGFEAGILSGLFGVGGGIITTPAIQEILGGAPYVAVGTPLPVIIPTAIAGGATYARAGEVSWRAIRYAAVPGVAGAVVGAWATELVDPHWLLLITAVLIGWQAVRVGFGGEYAVRPRGSTPGWAYAVLGGVTGLVSGLLGLGGGIVAVPGTIVHAALGHIDWAIFTVLAIGVVPGARVGADIALGTRERTLRLLVGTFLLAVSFAYGIAELVRLLGS